MMATYAYHGVNLGRLKLVDSTIMAGSNQPDFRTRIKQIWFIWATKFKLLMGRCLARKPLE